MTAVELVIKEIDQQQKRYIDLAKKDKSIKKEVDAILTATTLLKMKCEQSKEMEKQQIIDAGNSCAFKQHLHSDRINKMSMDELEQYNLEPSYTFGEEHYNEKFNK